MSSSTEPKPKNRGLAIASLTLGILAIPLGLIGIGLILGILAIVFGAVSIKDNRGKSLAGIITGSIGIIVFAAAMYFIFAVVPKATDDLQAGQRDTQRKNDISVLSSDVVYRMTEDRGVLPDGDYVNEMTYKLAVVTSAVESSSSGEPTTTQAVYVKGVDCDGNSSPRNYSISILLENGETYCTGS